MTLAIVVPLLPKAFALTDLGNAGVFEMDGNNITKESSGPLPTDWAALFTSSGTSTPLPPGGLSSGFVNDAITPDTTVYTTGSKDTLNIANNGWQCTAKSTVTPKDKILDVYSFAVIPSTGNRAGHLLIYAGYERFDNSGAGNIGIWLLGDPTVNCNAPSGITNFNGTHINNDLLVTAAFTTGGSVTTLNAFNWVGGANGFLNTTAVTGTDCQTASINANFCARSNTVAFDGIPWPVVTKTFPAGTLGPAEFFEVGIDLTGFFGPNPPCVNRFLFDSRSSPSPTADLHDFAVGSLQTCPHAKITTNVSPTPIALGGSSMDTATVTLTQATATVSGTVNFNAYGPVATNTPTCTSPAAFSSTVSISGTGSASVSSGSFMPSAPGYYFWIATYNPTTIRNGNTNSTTCGDTGETLLVIQSGITTNVSPTPIALGSSTSDTATVTLTPSGQTVSGSVTFNVYGPFTSAPTATSCTGSSTTLGPISINGASPATANSGPFTPSLPGYYAWIATYTPTGPANGPIAFTHCTDSGETLLVISSGITTTVSPTPITFGSSASDTATVTLMPPGQTVLGSVTFNVYGPFMTAPTATSCTGTFATLGPVSISGASPATANSGSFTPPAPGYYAWIATYNPTGAANGNSVSTTCGDSGETLLVVSIPKITAFSFTNTPKNNDPTTGAGTVTYTFTVHNFGTSPVTLSGSLIIGGSATTTCGSLSPTLTGYSLATLTDATFSMTCTYSGTSNQTVQAQLTVMYTDVNGAMGPVSGSPTTYTFTIQTKI